MADGIDIGRVQGASVFYTSQTGTSTSTTSITLSTLTPTDISPMVGDKILNSDGLLYSVTAVGSSSATVSYTTSIKGATGDKGDKGDSGADGTRATTLYHNFIQLNMSKLYDYAEDGHNSSLSAIHIVWDYISEKSLLDDEFMSNIEFAIERGLALLYIAMADLYPDVTVTDDMLYNSLFSDEQFPWLLLYAMSLYDYKYTLNVSYGGCPMATSGAYFYNNTYYSNITQPINVFTLAVEGSVGAIGIEWPSYAVSISDAEYINPILDGDTLYMGLIIGPYNDGNIYVYNANGSYEFTVTTLE